MAKDLFSDVTALVRKIMDDRDQGGGFVFPDTELYDFGTSVQRDIFERMVEAGLQSSQTQITRTVTSADSKINWDVPVGQLLPDDFEVPEKLWEKKLGDPDTSYIPMSNTSEILPDEPSAEILRYWIWQDDPTATIPGPAIKFIAPTASRTVRILYRKQAPKITAAGTVLYTANSYNAMAYGILALAAASRKRPDSATYFERRYEDAYSRLARVHQKGEQRRVRRRLPSRLAGIYNW